MSGTPSVTALDNQIRKKKRAIKEARDRVRKLEIQQAQLSEEYRERSENYERVKERVKHANEEIRRKDEVIEDLREQLQIKQGGGFSAEGLEEFTLDDDLQPSSIFVHESGEKMTSEEMVQTSMEMLKGQMAALQTNVKGGAALGGAMESGESGTQINVTVCYQRFGDYCSFRITPEYTFEQLNRDACKYWEVPVDDGTLRDHLNLMWPPQATVASELAKYSEPPKINLIARIKVADVQEKEFLAEQAKKRRAREARTGMEVDSDSSDEDEDEDAFNANTLIKEWRSQNLSKLSPMFHTPKLVAERNFRSLNDSGEDEEKIIADYLSVWVRMVTYGVFMYFFISSIQLRRRVPSTNSVHQSLISVLQDHPFPSFLDKRLPINFQTMHEVDDVWTWLEGPLVDTLFPDKWYNNQARNSEEERVVLQANRIVGGVRMRQYRSGNTKAEGGCAAMMPSLKGIPHILEQGCYNEYSMDHQRAYVASLGGDEAYGPGKEHDGFLFQKGLGFNSFSFFSGKSFYNRDSFVIELNPERGKAKASLWRLRDNKWIDKKTRGIMITFNIFNTNYYSLTSVKIFLEFGPTGYISKDFEVDTIWLSFYGDKGGGNPGTAGFLKWADVVIFMYVLLTVYTMLWEMALWGNGSYFVCVWNVADLMLCCGITSQLIYQLIYDFRTAREVDLSVPHFVHVERQTQMYRHGINLSVFNMVVAAACSFKLFQRNLSVSKIWQIMEFSGSIFLSYLFVFFAVSYAFLIVAHFSFGPSVEHFSTIMSTVNSLLVMLTGQLDYIKIRLADDVMAPLFFISFNLSVNFFLASVFFALVNDSYAVTNLHFDDQKSHFWKHVLEAPIKVLKRKWKNHALNKSKKGGGGKETI